jgi:hypothetical protein
MSECSSDFQYTQVAQLQLRSRLGDHEWEKQAFNIAFHQNDGVGKKQVAMGKLHVSLKKLTCGRFGLSIKLRKIQHLGPLSSSRIVRAAKISDWHEATLINDMG